VVALILLNNTDMLEYTYSRLATALTAELEIWPSADAMTKLIVIYHIPFLGVTKWVELELINS
jgi:hypothetical protein